MARIVSCRIGDRDDGRFDVVATIEPNTTYRREGFASSAEAEEWIEGLKVIMVALGAPVVRSNEPSRERWDVRELSGLRK